MATISTLRYIAAILLALCACGAFACCDADCMEDWQGCSFAAYDAVLSLACIGDLHYTSSCADAVTDQTAYLTHFAVTDIFRPPNALA